MRLGKLMFALAVASQVFGAAVYGQQLKDGQCTQPLNASNFKDFVENVAGLPEAVDFAISAPLMSKSPIADGKLSASEYANTCYFTFAENVNPGHSWPNLDNLNDGDADLTAYMHFAHTDKALFVAFEVFDDFLDLDFPANSFQNDGTEIFINPDADTGDDWGPGKFQVYADAAGDGDITLNNRGVTGGGPAVNSTGDPVDGEWYSAGLVRSDNKGYVVEYQIPLGSLDTEGGLGAEVVPAKTGSVLLINTAIDDNDEADDLSAQTGHHIMWHFDGAGSPWGGGENIWAVPLVLSPAVNPGVPGDINGNGAQDAGDIDELAGALRAGSNDPKYDTNADGKVNVDDHVFLVENQFKTYFGDSNLDKQFDSGDFVQVFQVGKYETGAAAGWGDGDWSGDAKFDSGDFVTAFQAGGYEKGPRPAVSAVPEPSSIALLSLGMLALLNRRRRA
jgi:hypothetical protein